MSYLDRSRVPPDVARRLVALAASSDGDVVGAPDARTPRTDDRPPRQPPITAPTGPTGGPPPLTAPGWARRGGREDSPAPRGAVVVGWTPGAPDVPAGAPPGAASDGAASSAPAAPEGRWEPSVTTALAAAARSGAAGPAAPDRRPRPRVRWAPGWRTTGAAVLVLALVAGAVALRAAAVPRGEPVAVPVPVPPASSEQGGPTGPATPDHAGQVVVHVVGAVAKPGVVRLPLGARVGDAIDSVGGSTPDADLAALNLARVVTDGEQLVVPVAGAVPPAVAAPASDGLVDLNTADEAALQELPGVGPVLAGRIVEHRARRPFTTVEELDDVAGVGPALMADLRSRVRV